MENLEKIIACLTYFIAGFIVCIITMGLLNVSSSGIEQPISLGMPSFSAAGSANAPSDWINLRDIKITEDSVTITVKNASISRYADTGSMKPTLDSASNGIRVVPENAEQIKIGDIITFASSEGNIVHRVVDLGKDDLGYWFLTKGDNNPSDDGMRVRFEDIKYITIGVLY